MRRNIIITRIWADIPPCTMLISPTPAERRETSRPALGYNGFYFDLWAKGVNEELCCLLLIVAATSFCRELELYPVDSYPPILVSI